MEFGVDDGARTHDDRNHNPGLYQLSYAHQCSFRCCGILRGFDYYLVKIIMGMSWLIRRLILMQGVSRFSNARI